MKVSGVRVFHVLPRWTIVAVDTEQGITGYGEAIVEGQSRVVEAAVNQLAEYLVGKDPRQVMKHWQWMYRSPFYRGGVVWMSAISGIEQALWDISGKNLGVAVHEMLGGAVRDRVRMYGHARPSGDEDGDYASTARAHRDSGMTAIKVGIDGPVAPIASHEYIDRQVSRIAAMRDAVGEGFDIAIDFHGRTTPATARQLITELESLHPFFVEEPCLPENPAAMADISRATPVPIATGERRFTRYEYRELLEQRAVSVVQPDLCHAGGIWEARAIAAAAETAFVSVAPHNPLGPISLAACLQLDAGVPNLLIQEYPAVEDEADLGVGILRAPFRIVDGYIDVPRGPGLGIDVDEDALRERAYDGSWPSPVWVHADGSHGDW